MVTLPLECPPGLVELSGYGGAAGLVALWWTPFGDELMYCDGTGSGSGNWRGWLAFVDHPVGRAILGPYELGSSDGDAEHWLLVDRLAGTLAVGVAADVERLLRTQPSELHALTAGMSASEITRLVDHAVAATATREAAKSPQERGRELGARMAREERLLEGLRRHLDELAGELSPRELGGERRERTRGRDEDPGLEIGF